MYWCFSNCQKVDLVYCSFRIIKQELNGVYGNVVSDFFSSNMACPHYINYPVDPLGLQVFLSAELLLQTQFIVALQNLIWSMLGVLSVHLHSFSLTSGLDVFGSTSLPMRKDPDWSLWLYLNSHYFLKSVVRTVVLLSFAGISEAKILLRNVPWLTGLGKVPTLCIFYYLSNAVTVSLQRLFIP